MATQRLTFLYPHLFHPPPLRLSVARIPSSRGRHQTQGPKHARTITGTTTQQEQTLPQRYGTAQEPQPPSLLVKTKPDNNEEDKSLAEAIEKEVQAPPTKPADRKKSDTLSSKATTATNKESKPTSFLDLKKPTELDSDTTSTRIPHKTPSSTPTSPIEQLSQLNSARQARQTPDAPSAIPAPLEKVLEMPAPTIESPTQHTIPHLAPPPYVHHFDTYTLVKSLQTGGWTPDQSISLMKAVRGLLSINLGIAKEGLVGKSDVENETYLFRAACSELRTEILNTRRTTTTTQRTQLHHLQHSADILSQRVSQETSTLKDELKGMLNDRRMASREQSQQRDSDISELNYRISARLIGDSKSEVEGLRWVLTRRAAIGIAGMALLILGSLRYGSYKKHEMEAEAEAKAKRMERGGGSGGSGGSGGGEGGGGGERYTTPSREMGTQTASAGDVPKGIEGVGEVSLG